MMKSENLTQSLTEKLKNLVDLHCALRMHFAQKLCPLIEKYMARIRTKSM